MADDINEGSSHGSNVTITDDRMEPHEPSVSELPNLREANPRLLPPAFGVPEDCPEIFSACGCGDCLEFLYDPHGLAGAFGYPKQRCPKAVTCRVDEAIQYYASHAHSIHDNDRLSVAKGHYKTVGQADRAIVDDWGDDTTTALLSLRTSPTSPDGERLRAPGAIAEDIMENWESGAGTIYYEMRQSLQPDARHGLEPDDWHYVKILSGTEWFGTPHLHIYAWIRDPDDEVRAHWFEDAVAAHVDNCQGAEWDHHPIDDELGREGTVTLDFSPIPPEEEIVSDAVSSEGERFRTFGAYYVAKQVPHLVLGDLRSDQYVDIEDERRGEVLTGAWAEAIDPDTFASSRGIPQDADDHGDVRFTALRAAVGGDVDPSGQETARASQP
jgi:hypothetical protein